MDNQLTAQDKQVVMSFSHHRHDVLNMLQLVRAYIQMNRTDKAIKIIDSTALWMQSLSMWTTSLEAHGEYLMWTAAQCPHVAVVDINVARAITQPMVQALSNVMSALETIATEHGWSLLRIQVHSACDTDGVDEIGVNVLCNGIDEQECLQERLVAFKTYVHIKVVVE